MRWDDLWAHLGGWGASNITISPVDHWKYARRPFTIWPPNKNQHQHHLIVQKSVDHLSAFITIMTIPHTLATRVYLSTYYTLSSEDDNRDSSRCPWVTYQKDSSSSLQHIFMWSQWPMCVCVSVYVHVCSTALSAWMENVIFLLRDEFWTHSIKHNWM